MAYEIAVRGGGLGERVGMDGYGLADSGWVGAVEGLGCSCCGLGVRPGWCCQAVLGRGWRGGSRLFLQGGAAHPVSD